MCGLCLVPVVGCRQDLLPAVVAGLAGVVCFRWPWNHPIGALAACVPSFAEHVLIVASYGIFLVHVSRPFPHGRMCAYGVRRRCHHQVIGSVALFLDACLDFV